MNNLKMAIRSLLLIVLLYILAGCGGGSSSGGPGSINTATPSGTSSLAITNSTLTQSENTTVTAAFTRADGTAASGITVTFATTLGTLSSTSTTTGTDGKATVTLMAGTTAGQGQVTASATYDGKTYVKTGNFQVSLPPLHLSAITLGADTLSYGGTTSVQVSVLDQNNAIYTAQEVDVYFTSAAATAGTASLSSPIRTVNGIATTTFKAITFTGSDTVTATITNSTVNKSITVTPLSAGSITYISAVPTNLALKGTGGISKSEVSTVTFKVLDSAGNARPNTTVDFALNTTVGGITLSASSGSTGSDGTVSVQVNSGTFSTPVRVTATIRGTTISTQSEQLVISTGLPAQDGFSISIANLSPEAWSIDGVTTTVTARLSDHFHNPVPDGTTVYFTTSGGSVDPSCTTVSGSCSVTWRSQNPRPYAPNAFKTGRAVILAYAIGEEAFVDLNGNGLADPGEFTDTTGAFRDDNENGVWDAATEPPIPFFHSTGYDPADGLYNGTLQGTAYVGAPKSKHVFSNNVLVMASSTALISKSCGIGTSITVAQGGSTPCSITVSDIHGNTMPSGTQVDFSYDEAVTGIKLTSKSYTFPNSAASSGATLGIILTDSTVAPSAVGRGIFTVSVKSPSGVVTSQSYTVN